MERQVGRATHERKAAENQESFGLHGEGRGEAPRAAGEGTEPPAAKREAESPASTEHLMEEVCERENLKKALKRVRPTRGAPAWTG